MTDKTVQIGSTPSDIVAIGSCLLPGRDDDLSLVIRGPRGGWLYGQYLSREQVIALRDMLTAALTA